MMYKQIIFTLLILVYLVIRSGMGYTKPAKLFSRSGCPDELIGPPVDWRVQDYINSQGITAASYDQNRECLVADCDLQGKDPWRSQGEIVLDLKYVPCLEANVPVDMTGRLIEVKIEIPADFVGPQHSPNGCQVFVKDTQWRSQYGTWKNCTGSGTVTVRLQPSTVNPDGGETTPGFDPTQIREIGVKIAINSNSTHQYKGTISICKIEVTPSLPFYSPPELPGDQPLPFVTAGSPVDIKADGFYIKNNKWFIVGGNWRPIEYRQNFGATAWYPKGNGVSIHPGLVGTRLEWFRQAGFTLVRIGLLDDGASMFDRQGEVVGYNDIFKNDVSKFLELATQYHVKVEFVLVDFLMAGKEEECNGVWLKGRREVIENPQVRQQFIKDFLEPFLNDFGNHPVLFGFDIINEPEWIIAKADGGGWEDVTDEKNKAETPISIEQFRNFVSQCSEKIQELAPGKFVTVGVSCPNTELVSILDDDLSYTAIHYYPWMGNLESNLAMAFGNKSWSLEEFPGQGDIYSYFKTVFDNGGAGALLWSLTPESDDQCYLFEDEEGKLQETRRFVDYFAALTPTISLDKTHLYFGAEISGSVTGSQTFLIDNSGDGILNWGVSDDAAWLSCSPGSGIGSGLVTVSVEPTGLTSGTYTGIITVSDPNAGNSPQTVTVTLEVKSPGTTEVPFGDFATPVDGSTVQSSVPVTGWVLDDLGVESVKIYRGEGKNLVYIGDAVFVEGARPDVEAAYPGYPFNYRAGWGYMMLTNFLPNQGNGTFTLHAIAADIEGNEVTLGTKTIICDNANAVKPFGAVDTPGQGGLASGSNYINWGWALTPMPNSIPTDGSTINVYVDGINLGHPVYNVYRQDIANLFPDYTNSSGAAGYFYLDTGAYANGVHTLQWTVADNAGNTDGIGSRYFSIQNTGTTNPGKRLQNRIQSKKCYAWKSQLLEIPLNDSEPIEIKRGFMSEAGRQSINPGESGTFLVDIRELDRIEIHLSANSPGEGSYMGYLAVGNQLRSLPIGSTFDNRKGIFYWQPGVGFLGNYQLVFIRDHQSGNMEKKIVTVRILQRYGK